MTSSRNLIKQPEIENLIFTIRGLQVMFDSHLVELYGIETKRLNEQVQRNKERFPESFRFQLSPEEEGILKSQIATSSSDHGGRRYPPYVFTEQGVAMLSAVLRSESAVKVSIQIMEAFVQMRKFSVSGAWTMMRNP
ncbi:MAG: ORF6N domain-containing protein [Saprospiraceae bacterium]